MSHPTPPTHCGGHSTLVPAPPQFCLLFPPPSSNRLASRHTSYGRQDRTHSSARESRALSRCHLTQRRPCPARFLIGLTCSDVSVLFFSPRPPSLTRNPVPPPPGFSRSQSKPDRPLSPRHGRSPECWRNQEGTGGDAHAHALTHHVRGRRGGRLAPGLAPHPRQRLAHSAGWAAVAAAAVGARVLRVLGPRRVCGARPATHLSHLSLCAAFLRKERR